MSLFNKHKRKLGTVYTKGFSLLEMLVYISILVLMLGVIMSITVSVVRSHRVIKASRSIENSAILALERINREMREADNIDITSSIFNSSPGTLVLDGTDSNDNPRTVEFSLFSGAIRMKENGLDLGAITEPDAQVTSLIFRYIQNFNARGVRAEMTIESGVGTEYKSSNFYSSATLR